MRCDEVREYLFAFLDNELDAPLSIEFQRHLERCAVCAQEVEIERTIRKELAAHLERGADDAPLDEAALGRALSLDQGPESRVVTKRLQKIGFSIIGLAAVVLIGLLVGARFRSDGGEPAGAHFADALVADFERFREKDVPLQYVSSNAGEVAGWLREATGLTLAMPPVRERGCRLLGARRCKIDGRTVALAAYEIDGRPASLLVTDGEAMDLGGMTRVEHEARTHWTDRRKEHTIVACRRDGLLYAAVSTLPERQLLCLMTEPNDEGD